MAIDQSRLDALKTLASGGTAGLNALNQARAQEQASRTTALQNAIQAPGMDVAKAAQEAQAKYTPNVSNPLADAGNLSAAANSFLNRGAAKLANDAYEEQANLTLKAAQMGAQQNAKNRQAQLQGAADIWAQNQREALNPQGLADLAGQKEALRNQLTAFDNADKAAVLGMNPDQALAGAQIDPQRLAILQAGTGMTPEQTQQYLAQRDQQRGDILRAMAGVDEQYKAGAERYAGALGLDAKGLMEGYGSDKAANVQGLLNYLKPQQEMQGRRINAAGQERLRELAPAFGIDELTAAGQFRDAEAAQGIQEAETAAGVQDYIASGDTANQAAQQEALTNRVAGRAVGLAPENYAGLKESTGLSDDEIVGAIQSDDWGQISTIANAYIGKDRDKTSGVAGFKKELQDVLNNGVKDSEGNVSKLLDDAGQPLSKEAKDKLLQLAVSYYSGQIAGSKSEAE